MLEFKEHKHLHTVLSCQRLEQSYLLRLNLAYNLPENDPNKKILIDRFTDKAREVHQMYLEQRELYHKSVMCRNLKMLYGI
jgi:hypothetical protein